MKKSTLKDQGFYHTPAWRRLRKQALERDHWLCQECLRKKRFTKAREVHHVRPLEDFPELALTLDNLESLCHECHEATKTRKQETAPPRGVRVIRIGDGS